MIVRKIHSIFSNYFEKKYRQSLEWQQLQVDLIQLCSPLFYKPSADGNLLVHWERVFANYQTTLLHERCPNPKTEYLSETLNSLVKEKSWLEDKFDFGRIDSLALSKSFGRNMHNEINGSWFENVSEWARGMYPTHEGLDNKPYGHERLACISKKDWDNNLKHIHDEGFHYNRHIRIFQYEWLDRIECANTGGSHHAAMVIHQIREQGYQYYRQAEVTSLSIDTAPLTKLIDEGYVAFVTGPTSVFPPISYDSESTEYVLGQKIASHIFTRSLGACSPNGATLFIIHKDDLLVPLQVFEKWYEVQISTGRAVPLMDLLNNTLKYCTTPYLHEVDRIYLGDPFRRSDELLRVLVEKEKGYKTAGD